MRLSQLKRTATSFAIIFVAYWIYSLVFVPIIEPTTERRDGEVNAAAPREYRSTQPFQARLRDPPPAVKTRLSVAAPISASDA